MKVWLDDLKEGDIFYHILRYNIYKCEHLGDAHNMNYRMPRIKFKVIESKKADLLDKWYAEEHEAFVNQYVYDDYNSALEVLKENLKKDYDITIKSIVAYKQELDNLESTAKEIKLAMSKYKEQDLEKMS